MPQRRHSLSGFCAAIGVLALLAGAPAAAADSQAAKNAEQYLAKGNLKAAAIELQNAIREAPQDGKLRVRLARVYLQLGDPVRAEREVRAARERNAAEADYLPTLIDALLRQDKLQDLVDMVRPGERPPALESQVRRALGVVAARQHDGAKAQSLLQDAIRLDPRAAEPKITLARLVAASNPAEANRLLDEVLSADPKSVEALRVKGDLARVKGDTKAAMSYFDAALEADPKNYSARISRASLEIAEDKYKAADDDLAPVLKVEPNNFMANYLRALALAKQKQYVAADRLLERLSSGFSQFPGGYYLQGATKLELGQNAQAESLFTRYLAVAPNDAKAARLAALAALRQRAPSRAVDYLKPIAGRSNAGADTLTLLGNAYMADGKPDLALRQFEKAATLDPNNPAIQTRVAISEIGSGQGKEGLAELERVFGTEAGAPIAGPTLALVQLRAGQLEKAAQVAASLIKRDAKNPLYLTLSGMVKAAQKDTSGAETAFRAALEQNPNFSPAKTDLAGLYLSSGRADDAKKLYQDTLSKKPEDEAALLGLANIAITEKKWAEANDYVNRARTAAPDDPAAGLAQVRLFSLQQERAKATAAAGALSAQFPSDLNVTEALGQAQLAAGDNLGALASYKRAYELAPKSAAVLSRYIGLLTASKDYRTAGNVLKVAIGREPKNAGLKAALIRITAETDGVEAAIGLATVYAKDDPTSNAYPLAVDQVYQNAGRWDDAMAALQKAVAAQPADEELTAALARLYVRTGNFHKAEELLAARLKADPKNTMANAILGTLYLGTGRSVEARKLYDALLAQTPNDMTGLLGLADVAIAEQKWPEAVDDIKRAIAAAPNDAGPGIKLVDLYIARQDWKNATASAAELAAKFPSNDNVLDAQARAQLGAGDTQAAIATYKRAYDLAPNSAPILFRYVSALNTAKNYNESRAVLEKALNLAPQNAAIKANLIRVAAQIGGVDAGLAEARDLAKNDPNNPIYDTVSAELLDKAGRSKEAIGLLERDLAAKPKDDTLRTTLAGLYNRAGDREKATTLLEARLKDDPANYAVGSALASLYLGNNNYDAAITQYSKLLAAHPIDPAILNNLAWLYQQKGDLPKARRLAEQAVAAAPTAAQVDDTLGWILLAQGDTNKALTYLRAASLSAPTDPTITYHYAAALRSAGHASDAQAMLEKLLGSGASFAEKPAAEKLLADIKHS